MLLAPAERIRPGCACQTSIAHHAARLSATSAAASVDFIARHAARVWSPVAVLLHSAPLTTAHDSVRALEKERSSQPEAFRTQRIAMVVVSEPGKELVGGGDNAKYVQGAPAR